MSPSIGGKPHFEGTVIVQSRNSQKKLQVHLSTPGKDPNWYITIDDVIKYDQNGNNLTPVVAYTKVGLQKFRSVERKSNLECSRCWCLALERV